MNVLHQGGFDLRLAHSCAGTPCVGGAEPARFRSDSAVYAKDRGA